MSLYRSARVGLADETYPIHAAPNSMNEVPLRAENARNTKKAARFGAKAVERLKRKKKQALNSDI